MNRKDLNDMFSYENGKLYWKIKPSPRIEMGAEAGWVNKEGRVLVAINGKRHMAHNIIYYMHHGEKPERIKHLDGNLNNNRIENLEPSTITVSMAQTLGTSAPVEPLEGADWAKKQIEGTVIYTIRRK